MSKIIFKNEPEIIYEVKFLRINENVIRLEFEDFVPDIETIASGIDIINEHNEFVMATYSGYETVYRTYDDNLLLIEVSNDGSVYSLPPLPEEPIPLTKEELDKIFENNKLFKIYESKYALSDFLERNPLKSSCHGGKEAYYNVTSEKQSLMTSNYLTYTIEKNAGISTAKLTWNATGEECEEWTEQEFVQLILEVSAYVKPLVSKQQFYESEIKACQNQKDLDLIMFDYASVISKT